MSDDAIRSGARWSDAIAQSLDESDFGIICVTRDNLDAPWLLFEAGALAKRFKTARVVPLCIDLAPSDISGIPWQRGKVGSLTTKACFD